MITFALCRVLFTRCSPWVLRHYCHYILTFVCTSLPSLQRGCRLQAVGDLNSLAPPSMASLTECTASNASTPMIIKSKQKTTPHPSIANAGLLVVLETQLSQTTFLYESSLLTNYPSPMQRMHTIHSPCWGTGGLSPRLCHLVLMTPSAMDQPFR